MTEGMISESRALIGECTQALDADSSMSGCPSEQLAYRESHSMSGEILLGGDSTLITFGPSDGAPVSGWVRLTSQLQSQYGLTFSSTSATGVRWLGGDYQWPPAAFSFDSGNNVISCNGTFPITIHFDKPIRGFSIWGFDAGGDIDRLEYKALTWTNFEIDAGVLEHAFSDPGQQISLSGSGITRVELHVNQECQGLFFDDLFFQADVCDSRTPWNLPSETPFALSEDERVLEFDRDEAKMRLSQLLSLQPFLEIEDDLSISFDEPLARAVGLREDAVELATLLTRISDTLASSLKEGVLPGPEAVDFASLDLVFRFIASGEAGDAGASLLGGCGGFDEPAPCPERVQSGTCFEEKLDAQQFLLGRGYHFTADYAGGDKDLDFTKVVPGPGGICPGGPFRDQARIRTTHSHFQYTYNSQSPEPNPEVLDYIPPSPTWPAYVLWWHGWC